MQSTIDHIESLVSKAGDLAETKVELFKLKMANRVSEAVSSVISKIAMVAIMGLALVIISIGAAYWIGLKMGNISYGFFIVGGFIVLMGILVLVFRKTLIKRPISTIIIDRITN